jgi:hypothetical protein
VFKGVFGGFRDAFGRLRTRGFGAVYPRLISSLFRGHRITFSGVRVRDGRAGLGGFLMYVDDFVRD